MSYCRKEGKDTIIFVTKEDHDMPSTAMFTEDFEEEPGLILPDGQINWSCPCLGGMATGPCGLEFREAFSCFHHSTAEPKGGDCYDQFRTMQECMTKYPDLYDHDRDEDDKKDSGESQGGLSAEDKDSNSSSSSTHPETQAADK